MCKGPVGLGAKRTRTLDSILYCFSILDGAKIVFKKENRNYKKENDFDN
jgi:hypothetical protein